MHENDFQTRLSDLVAQINKLPAEDRPGLERLVSETQDRHLRMKKTLGELQDSLDHLRLTVKYLVFDLEATRRENKFLRNLIDANTDAEERAD